MDGRVFHVQICLQSDIAHAWTIEEMAQKVNLSESHFRKLFKDETGFPPMKYLHDLRLEEARKLLESSFLQIKQIRIATGLEDSSHLTRDFKNKYGTTPTRHRKQCWEAGQLTDRNG